MNEELVKSWENAYVVTLGGRRDQKRNKQAYDRRLAELRAFNRNHADFAEKEQALVNLINA